MIEPDDPRPQVAVFFDALFSGHQTYERMAGLAEIAPELSDEDFWFIFREVWSGTKVLFTVQDCVRDMLTEQRLRSTQRHGQHATEALTVWRERIRRRRPLKTYRGCEQHNATGFSWTTNRKIAEAHALATGSPHPRVAIGRIDPRRIVMVIDEKPTGEVVVFPEHVRLERWDSLPAAVDDPSAAERRRVMAFGLSADLHAAALVKKCAENWMSVEGAAKSLEQESVYLAGLGFKKRPALLAKIVKILRGPTANQ